MNTFFVVDLGLFISVFIWHFTRLVMKWTQKPHPLCESAWLEALLISVAKHAVIQEHEYHHIHFTLHHFTNPLRVELSTESPTGEVLLWCHANTAKSIFISLVTWCLMSLPLPTLLNFSPVRHNTPSLSSLWWPTLHPSQNCTALFALCFTSLKCVVLFITMLFLSRTWYVHTRKLSH